MADDQREAPPALQWTPEPLVPRFDLFRSFTSFDPSFDEIWSHFNVNFTHRAPKSKPVRELRVDVMLSPQQVMRGGMLPIELPVGELCTQCEGTGTSGYYTCDTCGGHGMLWETARVDVMLSPSVRDGTVIPVPLRHLGVTNLQLLVRLNVMS